MRGHRHCLVAAVVVCIAAVCLGAAPPATAPAQQDPSPRAVVDEAVQQAIVILRDQHLATAEKGRQVRQIVEQHVDFETLSRLALGQTWREMSEAQRAEFVLAFRKHVVNLYNNSIDEYTNQDVTILGDRAEPRADWTVQTRILGRTLPDGTRRQVANVDYRLRREGQNWQVIDVTVDGISVVALFRAQFQAVVSNGGVERLLQILREKTARDDAKPTANATN